MSDRTGPNPTNDIYTVLLMVTTLLVAGATIYLASRSTALFGSWNPL